MKGELILPRTPLRGFAPRTYGENDIPKKAQIRDLLRAKISDIEGLKQRTRGKKLSVDVTFYLYQKSALQGRATKDIDNLFKIILDALPDYMDKAEKEPGLGLIQGVSDDLVFELHGVKHLVDTEVEEGIDIEISEWIS
jgi:hypothetical protein